MSPRTEIDIPSDLLYGKRVQCEDCKVPDDPIIWSTLYFAEREKGHQLTAHQKAMVEIVAEGHLEEHPDHRVFVFNLKRMG